MTTPTSSNTDDMPARLVSTDSLGEQVDDGRGRIFPCEGCGADLEFHIGQQQLKCPYCGFEKALDYDDEATIDEHDFHAALDRLSTLRQADRATDEESNEVRCESCGGTVVFRGTLTSSECPFCGSPIQRAHVHSATDRIPVDAVLPFLIEQQTARQNLAKWVRSRWFAPNDFKRRGAQGRFSGVYLPYWTYDTLTANRYRGERGEYYYVTVGSGKDKRRERRTRWYPASGRFQRFFDDVLVVASRGVPRKLIRGLEPWPFHLCLPFTPEVLAGYLARTYDVELPAGFVVARQRIDAAIRREVGARIGGDTQRIHSINTKYNALTYKHLLLPAWLMAYRYGKKSYRVVVNAGTGEVQGERPYSWIKITLAVLGGLVTIGIGALAYLR